MNIEKIKDFNNQWCTIDISCYQYRSNHGMEDDSEMGPQD